jgi:regulator of RNase E activity RraA
MKVAAFRVPIEVEGVSVEPGDLVFGDVDGVLVVPAGLVEETIMAALEKARGEKLVRKEIEGGMSTTAAFEKYGIL